MILSFWFFHYFFPILLLLSSLEMILCENHVTLYVKGCNSDQTNQFFDTTSLSCRACGSAGVTVGSSEQGQSQKPSNDGLSCVCRFGYQQIGHTQNGGILCSACPRDGEVASTCAACEFRTDNYNSSDVCESCAPDQITLIRDVDGSLLLFPKCISCQPGTRRSPTGDRCIPCSEESHRTGRKSCDCPESTHEMVGGFCLKISDLKDIPDQSSLYKIKYDYQELESSFFCHHIRSAVALCQLYSNVTSCQLLANLCVLSMYRHDGDVQNACTRYLRLATMAGVNIVGGGGGIVHAQLAHQIGPRVPWLYYQYESIEETTRKKDFEARYSFKRKNKNFRLNFTAAVYAADGRFLGLKPVSGRTWQLCGGAFGILDRAFDYGTRYLRKCRIPVRDLFNMPETVFYDPYVYYEVLGSSPVLYAVPVLIRNYVENDQLINKGPNIHRKYVRRFFLVDNVGGHTPCHAIPSVQPSVVKYAKEISIQIEMYRSSDEASRVYPPIIIIDYAEATLEDLSLEKDVEVSFSVAYKMDQEKEERDYSIAVGVLTGVGVLYSIIQTWSWSKRSGHQTIDFLSLIKFLLFCCGNLSSIFFTVTFLTCFYVFIFFKRQDIVYVVLPSSEQETLYIVMMVVAFILKVIQLVHILVSQIFVDIFFVDWERPQPKRTIPHPSDVSARDEDSVSIWRTYLVANEWAELQTTRYTSIGVQLFTTVFLLTVVGFENLASADPLASVSDMKNEYRSPDSMVCRMALAITVYLAVACVQWFFLKLIYDRFVEDKIRQFIDLCSISNISVFLMTYAQFGHYIHGRSVHGHADTDMKNMQEQLRREEDNLCSQRGLLANSDQQTFYIALPAKLRAYYDHVMVPLIRTNQLPARLVTNSSPIHGNVAASMLGPLGCSIQAYRTMNKFLASFLEHALRDLDYVVKDRLFVENLLDIEFQDPTDKGFFYIDNGHSYDAVLLCGQEVNLIMFDLLLFVCVDLIAKNFILASVVSFVVGKFIVALYRAISHRNLARKTLVDSRFLI